MEVLLFFRKVLFLEGYAIPWDLRGYHLSLAWFAAKALQNGDSPLWDPSVYCGRPLYANLTTQLFYPPTLVTLLVYNMIGQYRAEVLLYCLEWQLVLHIFAGGVFCYLFLRKLSLDVLPSLTGATVFQLGAFFTSQTQHLGAVDAAAWLPLCMLALLNLAQQYSLRWLCVLAGGLAASILAGFPAVTAIVFLSCGLVSVLMAVFKLGSWRILRRLTAAYALAVGICGIQLLPTIELTRLSVAKYRTDWLGSGGGAASELGVTNRPELLRNLRSQDLLAEAGADLPVHLLRNGYVGPGVSGDSEEIPVYSVVPLFASPVCCLDVGRLHGSRRIRLSSYAESCSKFPLPGVRTAAVYAMDGGSDRPRRGEAAC